MESRFHVDAGVHARAVSRTGEDARPPSGFQITTMSPGWLPALRTQAIIRVSSVCGLLNEASLGAPGIHVQLRVRSQVRTGISGDSRALAYGLLSQPC